MVTVSSNQSGTWHSYKITINNVKTLSYKLSTYKTSAYLYFNASDVAKLLGYADLPDMCAQVMADDFETIAGTVCVNLYGLSDAIRLSPLDGTVKKTLKDQLYTYVIRDMYLFDTI